MVKVIMGKKFWRSVDSENADFSPKGRPHTCLFHNILKYGIFTKHYVYKDHGVLVSIK